MTIEEYAVADRDAGPHAITTGTDGIAWFTEWGTGRVGSITADGTIAVHNLSTPGCEPHGITLGPDGALRTALEIGALARIAPVQPPSSDIERIS
ncbi:virginiamycin B lyase family protein [Sphaerimonospora sp. CA-214678]|uniref:virginiamycin B lyase family protein n=1 Tax=Sphaerimonospora sp. CA-214678 TaxID=3240029 RepID=UPI003D919A37